VAADWVGLVRLLDGLDIFVAQAYFERAHGALEVLDSARAYDWCRDPRPLK
jgi:hypothetical protein